MKISKPGVTERAKLGELRAELRLASEAWKAHAKVCYPCLGARDCYTEYCGTGWELAKRLGRARGALRRHEERPGWVQSGLW